MCWTINSAGETTENGPFGVINSETVASFPVGQPQLAWLAITGGQAPVLTMRSQAPLVAGTGGNSRCVGVQLAGIPADETLVRSLLDLGLDERGRQAHYRALFDGIASPDEPSAADFNILGKPGATPATPPPPGGAGQAAAGYTGECSS